jgi:type I restriction enzyme S subunit
VKLKPGYKRTEVGVIPEEWEVDRARNLASITTGTRNTQDKIEGGAYPFFVRSSHVERINTWAFDGEAVLTAGDGVGTGKVFHYINGKFDFHQRVYKISNFSERLDGYFFYLFFSVRFYERIMSMTAKSSVDSVRMEMIADMEVPLPPIHEQRAISTALSNVDALISSLNKLIAKKHDIKQAAMHQLLTGKKRLPGFSEQWLDCQLSDIGVFTKGKGIRKDEVVPYGTPCVRYGEIYTHHNDYIREFHSFIPDDLALESRRIMSGDLLFAGSGETAEDIGKCVAFLGEEEAYAGGDIVVFTPYGQDSMYLGYLMNHPSTACQKARMAQGDAIVHISAVSLGQLQLTLPPVDEQRAIASVLSDMDAEIEALERRRDKTRLIKQGMMQELLTGRVRLV